MTTTVYTDDELEAMAVRFDSQCNCNIDTSPCGAEDDCRENQKTAAMLRACKGRVRVKPLEWAECNTGNWKRGHCFTARSMVDFAPLAIHKKHDGWWLNKDCHTYDTLEAAKAAAQADYEARILAALEPAPDHGEWDAALEAAAKVVPQGWCQTSTSHIEMDVDLGQGIQEAIRALKKGQTND